VGKEPGGWSDDALWFIQATYRYIGMSGDIGLLEEQCEIANTSPAKSRTVFETIKAILLYSAEISVGKHGMPLLDHADWNDCLSLDTNFVDGPTKERLYKKQIEDGGTFGEPFKSDYSESVMNAFLLKLALDEAAELAERRGDTAYKSKLENMSKLLYDRLQKHAWKEDFFARVLLNRYKDGKYTYLGAKGDGLSADPKLPGTYFLNSFSWALLSGSATEVQMGIMLDSLQAYLKTPYGVKLCSPADLEKLASGTATGHYFPGDRENGAVFKHASMMAASAMIKAAKEAKDSALASRMARFAYWMIDLVLPYRTLANPYVTAGNPRFCTQYNNSDTGENIGPMLSGTASWLDLTLISAFGLEYTNRGIILDPILREEQEELHLAMKTGRAGYDITVKKPAGFRRMADGNVTVKLDGKPLNGNVLPLFEDDKVHTVVVDFK
jgi:cellobiose phosphorylase